MSNKPITINADGIIYEVINTDTENGTFTVEVGIPDNDESHIKIDFTLSVLLSDIKESGACSGVHYETGNDGFVEMDWDVEPIEIWENFTERAKVEYVEDDIIQHIRTIA